MTAVNGEKLAWAHLAGCTVIAAAILFSSPRFFPREDQGHAAVRDGENGRSRLELTAGRVMEPAASIEQLRMQLRAEIQKLKARELIPSCWEPITAEQAGPARSVYRFQMTFDESGREIARGISELREQPSRSDVATCLRNLPLGIELAPTGQRQQLEFDVSFG